MGGLQYTLLATRIVVMNKYWYWCKPSYLRLDFVS